MRILGMLEKRWSQKLSHMGFFKGGVTPKFAHANRKIKLVSDCVMGSFNLSYAKVFGGAGTFLSKMFLQTASPY